MKKNNIYSIKTIIHLNFSSIFLPDSIYHYKVSNYQPLPYLILLFLIGVYMSGYLDVANDLLARYYWVPFLAMRGSLTVWSCLTSPFFKEGEREVGEVSELFVHPIRALRPVKITGPWKLGPHGFLYDKGMCLLFKGSNERLKHTANGHEALFGINLSLIDDSTKLLLTHKDQSNLIIDLTEFETVENYEVEKDPKDNEYCHVGDKASKWISDVLGKEVRLMFSPQKTLSGDDMIIASLDPVHIIGESSLIAFSKDAGWDVEMERFRPNIVSVGQGAYEDETWQELKIGDTVLEFDHRTTRCLITNVNFDGARAPDTMNNLRKMRPRCEKTNKPVFGSYFAVKQTGHVKPGDKIILVKSRVH